MARVEALWEDEDGTPRVAPATLENRSHSGLSVWMKNPIGVGSNLTIKWQTEQFSGTVANCRRDGAGYVLGVQRDAEEGGDRN